MAGTKLNRGFGAVISPVATTGATTLASLDPGRDILLALFEAAINDELGPRWTAAVSGTSLDGTTPVQDTLPDEPTEQVIQQRKNAFPLLCVYRTPEDAEVEQWTMFRELYHSNFMLEWILGPSNVIERRRFNDAKQFVAKTVMGTVTERGHRAYSTTLQDSGIYVTTQSIEPYFDAIEVIGTSFAPIPFSEGATPYETLRIKLRVSERERWNSDAMAGRYDGARITYGIGDGTGIIPDAIETDTDWVP